jgi:hypothetical protein
MDAMATRLQARDFMLHLAFLRNRDNVIGLRRYLDESQSYDRAGSTLSAAAHAGDA